MSNLALKNQNSTSEPNDPVLHDGSSPPPNEENRGITKIIAASSAGTLIEWYDFYIFGSLATIISTAFFPKGNETVALLSTLATFATGFIVRPFGALVFGRIGDVVGRKYAFLATLLIMGGATTAIGFLPTYEQIGILAPILLVTMRLLQGLALGGEYGGAATYVAEHAPDGKKGLYTSFIQTTATLGLFVSIGVILATRQSVGEEAFKEWGWRVPFILSIALVIFSYVIRAKLHESPEFTRMKAEGKGSTTPIKDSFMNPYNRKWVILALFGATAGQGVVWYTGQFYALYYLQTVLKVNFVLANQIVATALLIGTPLFIVFGALSDKIGRKNIIMVGALMAAICYIPIYQAMATAAGFDPATGTSPNPDFWALVSLVLLQVVFVTMVYGPIAAFLVELFPVQIRYTSMSLPYHIGNGVFGGLVPLIGTWAVSSATAAGASWAMYAGLIYPITIALMTVVIGTIFLKDRRGE